jgi:hypothetical protein
LLRHWGPGYDERVKLEPSHGFPVLFALEQPEALFGQDEAGSVREDVKVLVIDILSESQTGK